MRGVYEQMRTFRENHQEAALTNVIIYFGTDRLPRNHPSNITTKISNLYATKEFPNTSIYFSAILPKFNYTFFEMINHVNSEVFQLCSYYHQLRFIQHQDFAVDDEMNKKLFWKDMIHTSNNGLRQLAKYFIKHIRFSKFS